MCNPSHYAADGNIIFEVNRTTLNLLQMRGLYGGLEHEDPHEHGRNFTEVCSPFSFKNMSQELMRLRLFPLSLMGEPSKCLVDLKNNSITSWEEMIIAFNVRFIPT